MRVEARRARTQEREEDGEAIAVKVELPRKLFPVSFWASFNKFGAFASTGQRRIFFPYIPATAFILSFLFFHPLFSCSKTDSRVP